MLLKNISDSASTEIAPVIKYEKSKLTDLSEFMWNDFYVRNDYFEHRNEESLRDVKKHWWLFLFVELFTSTKMNLIIDALSIVDPKVKVKKLYEILLESVRRNIQLNEDCILKQLKHSDLNKISLPQIYHFFPRKCGHFVTVAYPKKQMEDQLGKMQEHGTYIRYGDKCYSLPGEGPCSGFVVGSWMIYVLI